MRPLEGVAAERVGGHPADAPDDHRDRLLLRWPLTAVFIGFPLWYVLGLGDLAFPIFAAAMVVCLHRAGRIRVPRGFGIWLLFLLWMLCSAMQLDTGGRLIGFGYRFALYLAVTVAFVYVYNARRTITSRHLLGTLTIFWLVVVIGGYLALMFPLATIRTPLSYVMPAGLASNELVREMVIRRLTQFDPDSWVQTDPRPSAPFLYTNAWGNAYSLLMPFVVVYLTKVRHLRRFWLLAAAIPVSFVPAFLTLNRGMFIGLGVIAIYVGLRAALAGNTRAFAAVAALVAITGIAFTTLPVQERLDDRLQSSSTTEDRASLYTEVLERTQDSPLFGYGAPRPSEDAGQPSAGTQGQVWMVMFSHGFVGIALFMAWLARMYAGSFRRRDTVGWACNAVLLAGLVEVFYYGFLTTGLMIMMLAGALALRPADD